ncbi:hypothetical protein ACFFU1_17840 [Algibacter miyuki]|uniref:GH26 domain-containing protein n=1 Tax=Algibacter miyuki TaxID=1306933 RepID=A0ABV5H666_9FLAO|nr:hypothetical protein [Algibacter miyuki]MDN3663827.1 hypothetical protein [Algibacter miyuki]
MKLLNKYKKLIIATGISLFLVAFLVIKNNTFIKNLVSIRLSNTLEEATSEPVIAQFSFHPENENKLFSKFYHYRLKLSKSEGITFDQSKINQWKNDTVPLMITVETWGTNAISSYKNNPMTDLVNGYFDDVIKQLCNNLIKDRPHIYFRFNPEVEVPYKLYPWQGYVYEYIKAFEYFAKLCKTYAPQSQIVWGPSGYPGVLEYYPGDAVVDVASIVLKSNSEINLNAYPNDYSTTYDLQRRLHRLRFLDKPIFVFGSKQTPSNLLDNQLVTEISNTIENERHVIYASDNFKRPNPINKNNLEQKLKIGLYDPKNLLNDEKIISVEHLFADFSNLNDGSFQKKFNMVIARNHDVIVTFEPFPQPEKGTDLEVLQHITAGKYDEEINSFYNIILNTKRNVYLRYAHEMEIPITRYPWQSQDPIVYIKSFRYFMTFKAELPATLKRVWGPAGDRGSIEWYPGNDVVDMISIAIYGLPDKNITDPNKQESFKTIFNRKYRRIRFIDKPLFITEFGVKGPEAYQSKWLEAAAKVLKENPQIIGVNYFNMSDTPKAWGNIKPPDWSISKETLHLFYNTLNSD